MFLFGEKKTSYSESELFKSFTDYHSHILYGLDDGVKTPEESLKILELCETMGVETIWFTPHIMDDIPNTTKDIKSRFSQLQKLYKKAAKDKNSNIKGGIKLNVAAEYMMDPLFEKRLDKKDLLPLGELGMHLLVETSFSYPPYNFWEVLEKIKSKGYYPILAHPERYSYMGEKDYKRLKTLGVMLQINLGSCLGLYGYDSKKRAENLIKNGFCSIVGSDTHSYSMISHILNAKELSPKILGELRMVTQMMEI